MNPELSDSKNSGITSLTSVLVAGASGMSVPVGKNSKDEQKNTVTSQRLREKYTPFLFLNAKLKESAIKN